ncbi:MAG: MBL fold metallo-hydrolase [Halanaerobiales bacterium]
MKIYHLYHSGVAVDYQDSLFIFDYYKDRAGKTASFTDTNPGLNNGVVRKSDLRKYQKVYVFASHRHSDHFNPVIFDWQDYNSNIKYILSDDIDAEKKDNRFFMKKNDTLNIDNNIVVDAYGSTDQGISFLLKLADKTVFHAGDLNWWHWSSFSDEQLKQEEKDYKKEVDKLKDKKINVAFIPVDPRLKDSNYLAGKYFLEVIKPDLFIPIHFADQYKITEEFAAKFTGYSGAIAVIKNRGEEIIYK